MRVLAIDPGPTKSGYVLLEDGVPRQWGWTDNDSISRMILLRLKDVYGEGEVDFVAVEYLRPRGMPTSGDEMDTMFALGRMTANVPIIRLARISRHEVKLNLCGSARAKDSHIRQAVIDRFGGDQEAFGVKCADCKGKGWRGRGRPVCVNCNGSGWEVPKGPLAEIAGNGGTGHIWSAIAVALTFIDQQQAKGD